jgi:hypothetical protein
MIPVTRNHAERARMMAALEPYEQRLRELKRAATTAHHLLMAVSEERRELISERNRLKSYVDANASIDNRTNPQGLPALDEHASVRNARLDLAALERRLQEVEKLYSEAQDAWRPQCQLVTRCEEFLNDHGPRLAARA